MKVKLPTKKFKNTIIFTSIFFTSFCFASNLSFMIKDDESTESYLKIKNINDSVYLKLSCNNFINKIDVKIIGVNQSNFMAKNIFSSKVVFGTSSSKENWKIKYDDEGKIELYLEKEGFDFVRNLYKNSNILLDMKELESIKMFEIKNKDYLKNKLDMVFENCGIYF